MPYFDFENLVVGGATIGLTLAAAIGSICVIRRKPEPEPRTKGAISAIAPAPALPPLLTVLHDQPGLAELEERLGVKLLAPEVIHFMIFEERTGLRLTTLRDGEEDPTEPSIPALLISPQPKPSRQKETALIREIEAFLRGRT